MHCTRKITDDLIWVGGDDRRLAMFEGVYSVPNGVSYNSYLLLDNTTVLFDTVDSAVSGVFFDNLEYALGERKLDYVIVQHMEPDHSATLRDLLIRHPETTVVCNTKTQVMIKQFFGREYDSYIVKEGDFLNTGKHSLTFVMAPMVHWPEVMVTFDTTDGILFSADAFGTFGALNGAMFADEVDFFGDYLSEARRYYCNIVGKYGPQVQSLLKKASGLDIKMICPLHGFVWRSGIGDYIEKYLLWSSYKPEKEGVLIAYASVYGNTENAANILSVKLREKGIKTVMFDVSVTPASEIIAAAFCYSHLVFASTTYNAGIFVTMDELLRDLAAHNIQNRTVAFIENGSWAPTSGKLMKEILSECKNMTVVGETVTIKSSLSKESAEGLDALVEAICESFPKKDFSHPSEAAVDNSAVFSISYGLYVLSAKDGEKDNGCIINTAQLVTDSPKRIAITVNKANYTHDIILKTGVFNLSVLSEDASFDIFKQFGFSSGRERDKFDGLNCPSSENGVKYLDGSANAVISGKVQKTIDCNTHTVFIADITEAFRLSDKPSATYEYYLNHIKPKPPQTEENKVGFVCKICGYVYEGETLPADYICPLCKHGAEDFEPIK
ncbi:MAG: flavin reductase [Clostridia bacterium]|nr:flavin reductase [Clostridia bacterium]